MSRRVLVTGVGGFIGRRMAERLRDRGDVVVGLDRVASPAAEALCLESGGRLVLGDACDVDDVRAAAAGCDLVVHTAAIVAEAGDWREFIRVNAHSVRSVAQACRAEGVPELVHLSSVMVHGFDYPEDVDEDDWIRGDGNAYCWSKIVSEQHALAAHEPGVLDVYVVRPRRRLRAGLGALDDPAGAAPAAAGLHPRRPGAGRAQPRVRRQPARRDRPAAGAEGVGAGVST